jgi:hypothetical protein
VKLDVPNAYIVGAPIGYFFKKGKVQGFKPHPNDMYFIDSSFSFE